MPTLISSPSQNGHASTNVQGLQQISSSLKTTEQKQTQKQVYKNTVSNQKDVTIDLNQFLDLSEGNKYIINEPGNN